MRQGALRHGERVACVLVDAAGDGPDRTLTYGELDAASRSVARALLSRGLPQGARVALSAENGDGFLAGFFGACYAGCTVVPIPILSAPAEVALRVQRASCAAALVDDAREPIVQEASRLIEDESLADQQRQELSKVVEKFAHLDASVHAADAIERVAGLRAQAV